jgi:hypothetical protein
MAFTTIEQLVDFLQQSESIDQSRHSIIASLPSLVAKDPDLFHEIADAYLGMFRKRLPSSPQLIVESKVNVQLAAMAYLADHPKETGNGSPKEAYMDTARYGSVMEAFSEYFGHSGEDLVQLIYR